MEKKCISKLLFYGYACEKKSPIHIGATLVLSV